MRILIVRLGAMGDILHALPAVTALRSLFPDVWIGWVIEPRWTPLLRSASLTDSAMRGPRMPVVDLLHEVPAKQWAADPLSRRTLQGIKAVRRDLRAQQYQICVDLQGAVRSAWLGRMASPQRMIGESYPREWLARWFFGERVRTAGRHVIEQAREVVSAAFKQDLSDCTAALPVDPDDERWCDEWLAERSLERFVMFNPGAGWGAKRWPLERYDALARELWKLGYAAVVNAGPGEWEFAENIRRRNPRAFSMKGTIGQLIACTRRASLAIGGDTGPMHLAAALKVPVVGIYGPTDPARNGPHGTPARVLRHPSSKRDHSRKSEPEAGLLTITVEDVMAAAQELLGEHSRFSVPGPELH